MRVADWKIGNVKIVPIVETDASKVIQEIIPNATKEEIFKIPWLRPHFVDIEGNLKAVVQAFVVDTGKMRILIDACVGNSKMRNEIPEWNNLDTNFLGQLKNKGYSPEMIGAVICTHLHFDHVGWNTMLINKKWVPTFPKARYLFVENEYNYWKNVPESELADDHAGFRDSVLPVFDAGLVELVDINHRLSNEISLIPTPGHTPAHVSVLVRSGKEQAVITGDVFHHPCQIARPNWMSFDTDKKQALNSRHAFLERFADTETLVIGSHFASPAAGLLRRDNGNFKLVVR